MPPTPSCAPPCVLLSGPLVTDEPFIRLQVFGLMVLTCLLGCQSLRHFPPVPRAEDAFVCAASITSVTGYRWALCLGALGYAPYAGGLVLNLNTGATWLVYLGSITCGLSAGLFWSVEGAIALGCAFFSDVCSGHAAVH